MLDKIIKHEIPKYLHNIINGCSSCFPLIGLKWRITFCSQSCTNIQEILTKNSAPQGKLRHSHDLKLSSEQTKLHKQCIYNRSSQSSLGFKNLFGLETTLSPTGCYGPAIPIKQSSTKCKFKGFAKATVRRCSLKSMFLKITQILQKSTCVQPFLL